MYRNRTLDNFYNYNEEVNNLMRKVYDKIYEDSKLMRKAYDKIYEETKIIDEHWRRYNGRKT